MDDLFTIDTDDFGNLVGVFQAIADRADDVHDPLMEAGHELQRLTIQNYENEGALSEFGFWAPLSSAYEDWKILHFPGRHTLQLHDPSPLEEAIYSPQAVRMHGPHEVRYTIADEKAAWHQFGIDDREQGGFLPARPIIPDGQAILDQAISPVFGDWVEDVIHRAVREH